jgi:predicted enzyme related to lactoylglutathione lyase
MPENTFFRYQLRTTNISAAREFYGSVVGAGIWDSDCSLSVLPERAAALGAPAHWLGHVGVSDVEATADRLVALGAQRLGPPAPTSEGATQVVLRDPFGAVLAVDSSQPGREKRANPSIVWHQLNVRDHLRAFAVYAQEFGWVAREVWDLPDVGTFQTFAWAETQPSVGSVADLARSPRVHTHWLFFFRVTSLDAAEGNVRAFGGRTAGLLRLPSGERVAVCEDPQGAAFALHEARTGVRSPFG